MTETTIRCGYRPAHELFEGDTDALAAQVERAESLGIDFLMVGDHVSFKGGYGYDGLIQASALLTLSRTIGVQTAVYLLPLRHPVLVARQLATISGLAPGRLVFGVGVGGEDRHEMEICGVDPSTRGRRMDECVEIVRRLLAGETLSYPGRFFELSEAEIKPTPARPVPLLVGGRADAALRRAGRFGDGWLGQWSSPGRYAAAIGTVVEAAAEAGRGDVAWGHSYALWAGFADRREDAARGLGAAMEDLYKTPWARFERYAPVGPPEAVADFLRPYVDAGCTSFSIMPWAEDPKAAVEGVAEVRRLLNRGG